MPGRLGRAFAPASFSVMINVAHTVALPVICIFCKSRNLVQYTLPKIGLPTEIGSPSWPKIPSPGELEPTAGNDSCQKLARNRLPQAFPGRRSGARGRELSRAINQIRTWGRGARGRLGRAHPHTPTGPATSGSCRRRRRAACAPCRTA